jgi:hypothetical protein
MVVFFQNTFGRGDAIGENLSKELLSCPHKQNLPSPSARVKRASSEPVGPMSCEWGNDLIVAPLCF